MSSEALVAGFWAAIGSMLGKLSGSHNVVGDSYVIWFLLLAVMIVANTWGCRYYMFALDAAYNSVTPTVVASASNYIFSGVIGIFLFKEEASIRWWLGATLITIGLGFVHTGKKYRVTAATQSNQNTSTNF